MRPLNILVLGGSGFVGLEVCAHLIRAGHAVRVLTRKRERHKPLLVLPGLELVNDDVHDPARLIEQVRGRDAVINLVGILNERGGARSFQHVHVDLARTVVAACRSAGVPRLLHMSALGADSSAPSRYLRSKAEAERIVRGESGPVATTIFRPSVIFGRKDSFVNRFAGLLAVLPVLPLPRSHARMTPVYVGDVAQAFVHALAEAHTAGRTYDLVGPDVLTLGEIVREIRAAGGYTTPVLGLPAPLGALQGLLMGLVPGQPFSLDNYRSLGLDSVTQSNGLPALGVTPVALRSVMPLFLGRGGKMARYDAARRSAGLRQG